MITRRIAAERGHSDTGWLNSWHTFSFSDYHDAKHMGFRSLRVINDDRVAAGGGFGTHPHRDMEIITMVLEGSLEHKDSLGTGSVIAPGDVQRMSAGAGIRHSEFNHSKTEPVHFLQIWILPEQDGLPPSYEQRRFAQKDKQNTLRLVAAPKGHDGALTIHQNASLYLTTLSPGNQVVHTLKDGRYAWVHVATGAVTLNGKALQAGDAAAVSKEAKLTLVATAPSEVLLFDLA